MIGRHDRDGKAAALRVMAEEDVRGGATFAISGDDMAVRQYTGDVGGEIPRTPIISRACALVSSSMTTGCGMRPAPDIKS